MPDKRSVRRIVKRARRTIQFWNLSRHYNDVPHIAEPEGHAVPRHLFVTRIPKDFDPAVDVALSPACFAGVEARFPEWSKLHFLNAYPDKESLYKGYIMNKILLETSFLATRRIRG